MIRTLRAFLEFCYIARREVHNTTTINTLSDALQRFQTHREIFVETGVRKPHSTPQRQHSLVHYARSIRDFGSLNGLCSSITESKHIAAVKKPWRRSNRYNALNQMLTINSRSDKLSAARDEFISRGMLRTSIAVPQTGPPQQEDDDGDVEELQAGPTIQLSASVRGM